MTFEQVLAWCRANGADVRGVYRGKDISITHTDERLPGSLPSIGEIFHWDLKVGDLHHAASAFGPGKNGDRQAYDRRFQKHCKNLTTVRFNLTYRVPTRLDGALEPVSKPKLLAQFFGALL